LETYGGAWVKQDPDLILEIFCEDGVYSERVFQKPFVGHKEIREYWQKKVVEEQSDIRFTLLNIFIDGDIAIAEWEARFYSNIKKRESHIREVAIFEIENDKVKSLRADPGRIRFHQIETIIVTLIY